LRRQLPKLTSVASPSVPDNASHDPNMLPPGPLAGRVRPAEPPAVVTVTVAVVADPLSVTELGDIEQVEWAGAPLQLSAD
jgi:hypothetical protein